jgi:gluconokinase
MPGTTILALDLGTSSCRSALFDVRARRQLKTTAQRTYVLRTAADGTAELDPAAVLGGIEQCIDATLARAGHDTTNRIAAVGMSCFWHGLIGVDAEGGPLTPIITWADRRPRVDAGRLRQDHDEVAYHRRTGCMLRAPFWPAKLAWIARTRKREARAVRWWLSPADWLLWRWCGSLRTAHGMATATGLYRQGACAWDVDALAIAGVAPEKLPAIDDAPLRLGPGARRTWRLLRDAQWFPGIGDGAASNLGAGAATAGTAAINHGTSAAVRVMRRGANARAPFGLFCYRVDRRRHLVGGAVSNAGNLFAWCQANLRLPTGDALEAALAARALPMAELAVLPAWLGERAPSWREDGGGAIAGITQATSALDLAQAVIEGGFQRLAQVVERVLPGTAPVAILVGGGIQHSPGALQRLADVLGRELVACAEPETSLRGAGVFALESLGVNAGQFLVVPGTTVSPRAEPAAAYRAARARLIALEARMYPEAPAG